MHYFIDGYNLLFYLFGRASPDLKSQRNQLIYDLNIKIEALALDVSLIFDSHLCPGEGSRSHFGFLEIVYTPHNMTADDFMIKKIKRSSHPTQEVLVTNDRELASRARHLLAHTQTLDHFLNWLDRRYRNLHKKKAKPLKLITKTAPSNTPIPSQHTEIHQGTFEFYLSQFESAYQKLVEEQEIKKEKKKPSKHKLITPETETTYASDFERWLSIFEQQDKKRN
jgi:hypothetical protein